MLNYSPMRGTSRHSLIRPLHTELPHGAPFDVATLATKGVSAKQAARYVESGWLIRLGQGVYAFPSDKLDVLGCILLLQKKVTGLHVAGKSAMALHGVRHNVRVRETWVLWGDQRFTLPEWFTARIPARYIHSKLFDWRHLSLNQDTITTPVGNLEHLKVSVPERAVLEMLSEVGIHQDLEEARNLFDGLRNLRTDVLGELLSCCTSVKTVRLFLFWARETGLLDVDQLLKNYKVKAGSKSRWMSRLKDGTLLTLKPHG
jgi:hypothetical protein